MNRLYFITDATNGLSVVVATDAKTEPEAIEEAKKELGRETIRRKGPRVKPLE